MSTDSPRRLWQEDWSSECNGICSYKGPARPNEDWARMRDLALKGAAPTRKALMDSAPVYTVYKVQVML